MAQLAYLSPDPSVTSPTSLVCDLGPRPREITLQMTAGFVEAQLERNIDAAADVLTDSPCVEASRILLVTRRLWDVDGIPGSTGYLQPRSPDSLPAREEPRELGAQMIKEARGCQALGSDVVPTGREQGDDKNSTKL